MNVYSAIGHRGGLHKTNSSFFVAHRIAASFLVCFALLCFPSLVLYAFLELVFPFGCPKSSSFSQLCSPSIPPVSRNSQGFLVDFAKRSTNVDRTCSTYSLVQVDGVLAGDNVGNGRALLLLGLDVGHFW